MDRRNFVTGCLMGAGALAAGAGAAAAQDRGDRNRDIGRRFPNLAAAQHYCEEAYERIEAAQRANEFDLGGHADRAKELLQQANHELQEAAEAAAHRRRR